MRFNDEIVGEDRKSADADLDCHHSLAAHMRTLPAFFRETLQPQEISPETEFLNVEPKFVKPWEENAIHVF
jgi:hypothetical protein